MTKQFCTNCGFHISEKARFCPSCGTELAFQVAPRKNQSGAPVTSASSGRKAMSRRAKLTYAGLSMAILAAFFFIFGSYISEQPHPVIERQQTIAMPAMYSDQTIKQYPVRAQVQDGRIVVPLSLLLKKKMLEFEYQAPNTVVPLLAYVSNEGKLVTSIRFCEPCNSKSFTIEGKDLVCGNCGTRWNVNNLRGISGSCQKYPPAPIPSEIVGNEIHIDEQYGINWKLRM